MKEPTAGNQAKDLLELPENLPVPEDDGAARHLLGSLMPQFSLPCTDGTDLQLSQLPRLSVLFFYPRTGIPGRPTKLGFLGETWEAIPGARGCTPQCKGFSDLWKTFTNLGVSVFGVSTQSSDFQQEFKRRQDVPFEFLSDESLLLSHSMNLPTFEFPVESGGPNTLIRRMAWFVCEGRIQKLWYPVFPPNECAQKVLDWLQPRATLYAGITKNNITYKMEQTISPTDLSRVFASSGINRPTADKERLGNMLAFANAVISARDARGQLIGVLRGFTDFAWCTYVSDLAVTQSHQKKGIGKELLEFAKVLGGSRCSLILNAAPTAASYYPHIGMSQVVSAWNWRRTE
jgi:peroxiredoxin